MANTYTLISSQTVSTPVSSITFSSIPSTYTDLKFMISARMTEAAPYGSTYMKINGSQIGNVIFMQGNGTTVTNSSDSSMSATLLTGSTATANMFSNSEINIPNYAGASTKSFSIDSINETNGNPIYSRIGAGSYASSATITSLGIATQTAENFVAGSTFYLYGIKNS